MRFIFFHLISISVENIKKYSFCELLFLLILSCFLFCQLLFTN